MQSHQTTLSSLFNTPFNSETRQVHLSPPEPMRYKFGENRRKFMFNGDIPEFLFIPSLDSEECSIQNRHNYLKPRAVEAQAETIATRTTKKSNSKSKSGDDLNNNNDILHGRVVAKSDLVQSTAQTA